MSILNENPAVSAMGLKNGTQNRLREANIHYFEDILAVLNMSLPHFAQEKSLSGVVAKFTKDATLKSGLRRFGQVAQSDLLNALVRAQMEISSKVFSELASHDDEESEVLGGEDDATSNIRIDFFLDDTDDDTHNTFDADISELEASDIDDGDGFPLETLLIGVTVAKGLNETPLMIDAVADLVADLVTEDSALDMSYKDLDQVVSYHIKTHGWPVDAPIYVPVLFAKRYTSVVAELSRIAAVVLTNTF